MSSNAKSFSVARIERPEAPSRSPRDMTGFSSGNNRCAATTQTEQWVVELSEGPFLSHRAKAPDFLALVYMHIVVRRRDKQR